MTVDDPLHMFSRVVVCGDVVEVYYYSSPIKVGQIREFEIVRKKDDEKDGVEKRMDNVYRARQNVRRLIWANMGKWTKFLTLTYAQAEFDIKKVKRDITTFCQSMKRKGYPMKYLYVLEHQKERGKKEGNEGSLHVHMVLFIDKFIPYEIINKCWKHGQTDIHVIDDVKNLGAYVCKYLTKETVAEYGMRSYSCSLGLSRGQEEQFFAEGLSTTYDGQLHPDQVLEQMEIKYSSQMRHEYLDDEGVYKEQLVKYYQGKWKDIELLLGEQRKRI